MTEKKMENPYYALGEAFVASVVAGNRGKITGNQIGVSDRLREYAYFVQENAIDAGDAMLVNDLLDAARQLQRQAPAIQPQQMRERIAELQYEAGMYQSLYESLWACSGCGTRKSMEQIKGETPQAISCCPEREMVPALTSQGGKTP